jgi:Uncharacterized protein conserved in bacteria
MMEREKALERMMMLCSRSEHSSGEIAEKLLKLEAQDAAGIVAQLQKDGFIDDRRFAAAFVHDKSILQGWGSLKIKLALQRKGVAQQIISEVMEDMETGKADERLESLLRTKWRSLSSEEDLEKKKMKLFRYALGRGYEYGQIKRIYDIIRSN